MELGWTTRPWRLGDAVVRLRHAVITTLALALAACGGGGDAAPPLGAAPAVVSPVSLVALDAARAGTIDTGATGVPIDLRVATATDGNAVAVWLSSVGSGREVWANRYRQASGTWAEPVRIGGSDVVIDQFALAIDPGGNAFVVWHEVPRPTDASFATGAIQAARFDAGTSTWGAAMPLSDNARGPEVAADATGAVLAVYVAGGYLVYGRFFDAAAGAWQPEVPVEQNRTGTGYSNDPVARFDGSGNVLVAYESGRSGPSLVGSSHYRVDVGWPVLASNQLGPLGVVPDSFTFGALGRIRLVATGGGSFVAAWPVDPSYRSRPDETAQILTARFTMASRSWTPASPVVTAAPGHGLQLQGLASGDDGRPLLLWTDSGGPRTLLQAARLEDLGTRCGAVHAIDAAVGGTAIEADLAASPDGRAIAVWQQREDAPAGTAARGNIAFSRFDPARGAWAAALLAEDEPGDAQSPRASVAGGAALLGWIQSTSGAARVRALELPLTAGSP